MNRMPIEDYLLPGEKILFWSDFHVTYNQNKYRAYITNLRLLLYVEKGIVFKKEEVITENWPQISGLQFRDIGGLSRRGILNFSCSKGEVELEGPKNGTLGLFKAIQKQTLDPNNIMEDYSFKPY